MIDFFLYYDIFINPPNQKEVLMWKITIEGLEWFYGIMGFPATILLALLTIASVMLYYAIKKWRTAEQTAASHAHDLSLQKQEAAMMTEIRSLLKENDARSEARSSEIRTLIGDQNKHIEAIRNELDGKIGSNTNHLIEIGKQLGSIEGKLDTFIGQFH